MNSANVDDRQVRRDPSLPHELVRSFGAASDVARDGVRALYEVLAQGDRPEVLAALDRWMRLASGACGHDVGRPSPAADALADRYGIARDGLRPAEMLFAVQTYYALVVKRLVRRMLAAFDKLPPWAGEASCAGPAARSDSIHRVQPVEDRMDAVTTNASRVLEALDRNVLFKDDLFSWYAIAWNDALEQMMERLASRFRRYGRQTPYHDPAGGRDLLKALYEDLFPGPVRHVLGEYYTPDWLARHVLDEVDYHGEPERRLLDPACGSGTFLVMAIGRMRAWHAAHGGEDRFDPGDLCRKILASVVGFDLNPLAVLSARANYLIAIGDLLRHLDGVAIPVYLRDSILEEDDTEVGGGFDCVVGNPPWIAWDHLPDDYRRATKPLWQRYGLFSLSGKDARHGGGKKDLSALMLYAAADRYLKDRGRLSMVVTQTLFQTKGAGDGFRRFRLGRDGARLRVLRVDDLADFQPFSEAANWTATITIQKGSPTAYPVPYVKWSLPAEQAKVSAKVSGTVSAGKTRLRQPFPTPFPRKRRYLAEPIDPGRPTSAWFLRPEGLKADLRKLVGPSDYQAHLGANTGGANGVYWVTVLGAADGGVLVRNIAGRGKRAVATVQQVIEPDLLYPLVRWADVARYHAVPSAHLVLAQDVETRRGIDEATMRRRYPKTCAYLRRFASVLSERAAFRRYFAKEGPADANKKRHRRRAAFYSMYNVGRYTVAPVKVVWRRMDRRIRAAVVEQVEGPGLGRRPVIPQETCVLIATESADEAHYLCALLNSSVVDFLVRSHSVRGGKGFGTPGMLDVLRLRRFDPANPQHAALAGLSRQAHQAAAPGNDTAEIQRPIDLLAGSLWGLSTSDVQVIKRELGESSSCPTKASGTVSDGKAGLADTF